MGWRFCCVESYLVPCTTPTCAQFSVLPIALRYVRINCKEMLTSKGARGCSWHSWFFPGILILQSCKELKYARVLLLKGGNTIFFLEITFILREHVCFKIVRASNSTAVSILFCWINCIQYCRKSTNTLTPFFRALYSLVVVELRLPHRCPQQSLRAPPASWSFKQDGKVLHFWFCKTVA